MSYDINFQIFNNKDCAFLGPAYLEIISGYFKLQRMDKIEKYIKQFKVFVEEKGLKNSTLNVYGLLLEMQFYLESSPEKFSEIIKEVEIILNILKKRDKLEITQI